MRLSKSLFLSVLVVSLGFLPVTALGKEAVTSKTVEIDPADVAAAQRISRLFNQIARKVSSSVVHIDATRKIQMPKDPPHDFKIPEKYLERFFGPGRPDAHRRKGPIVRKGIGSGTIIGSDGYILTNNHVVEGASTVNVILPDGRSFVAEWVRYDPSSDLALIKIDAKDLPALEFADSKKVQVGDWVIAAGNPFGLDNTVTQGIVSYIGRNDVQLPSVYSNYIQTDAAVNPGNSGGPLVNLFGKVIGINSAIMSRTRDFAGISFAIPAATASFVAGQLRESEHVVRSYLGVGLQPGNLNRPLARSLGLDDTNGAMITSVMPDSPAGKAGLKEEDVILKFNNTVVTGNQHLQELVTQTPPGKTVTMQVWREKKALAIKAKLDRMPENFFDSALPGPAWKAPSGKYELKDMGLTVDELTEEFAEKHSHIGQSGVLIDKVAVDSPASRAELRSGELILRVNSKPVKTVEQFKKAIEDAKSEGIRLHIRGRGGSKRSAFVQMK